MYLEDFKTLNYSGMVWTFHEKVNVVGKKYVTCRQQIIGGMQVGGEYPKMNIQMLNQKPAISVDWL